MRCPEKLYPVLRDALKRRLDVVANVALRTSDPAAHLESLKDAAAALDACVALLPADADPMIRHYLERQSYLKALAWLEGHGEPTAQGSLAPQDGI